MIVCFEPTSTDDETTSYKSDEKPVQILKQSMDPRYQSLYEYKKMNNENHIYLKSITVRILLNALNEADVG